MVGKAQSAPTTRANDTYFKLIQDAPFGVYLVDGAFRLAQVSRGAQQVFANVRPLLGRDFEEVLHKIWPAPFADEAVAIFRHTLATGEPYHSPDTTEQRADVDIVESYDWQIERVTLPDGSFGVVCYFYDMTPHRRAEAALRESEARYRAVVESQSEMVCRFEPDGRILFVNPAYARNMRLTPEDLVGKNFWDFVTEHDRAHVGAALKSLSPDAPEATIENRFETAEGPRWTLWTNRALRFDKDGRVLEAQSAGIDITDRKRVEEALRESEARFRNMADHAPVMIRVTENDSSCSFLSQTWYDYTGQTPETGLGFGWLDALHPDDAPQARNALLHSATNAAPFRLEYRLRGADGQYRWFISAARPRLDQTGQFLGYISSITDIDERRKAEEHRKLLVDELNHRVKNTLAVVQSLAMNTFKDGVVTREARRAFDGRLASLAGAHALLSAANWQRTSLAKVVESALRACGADRDRFTFSGAALALEPKAAITLTLALHELCTNAIKHGALTSETGRISLTWQGHERQHELEMEWRESGGPKVSAPRRRGFGTVMMERALAHDIGGNIEMRFEPQGFSCTIRAPI
jgi:PAS domain S-box-containing protein